MGLKAVANPLAGGGTIPVTAYPLLAPDSLPGAPAYSFSSSPTTGISDGSSNTVSLVAGGVRQARWDANGFKVRTSLRFDSDVASSDLTALVAPSANLLTQQNGTNPQTFEVYGTTTGPKFVAISHDGTNGVLDTGATSGLLSIAPTNATSVTIGKLVSSYNGTATAGAGVVSIRAAGRVTAQAAANASISTFTVGAADGSFEVSGNVNVTVSTALATTLTCTYTDESNTARSMILPIQTLTGTFVAGGAITGVGAWESPVMHIRCKAATVITILTSTGTFTGVTYTAEGIIKQTA